ncbi:MAG: glycosyltransferase [Anaerolineae bacterium]
MRVLFVTPFYEPAWGYGGVVRAAKGWASALSAVGVQVSVLTTVADGRHDLDVLAGKPVDVDGVPVTYYPRWRRSGSQFVSPSLLAACRRESEKFDVVHSVGLWTFPSVVSSWAAWQRRVPYVVSLHGMLMPWALRHHGRRKRLFMAWPQGPCLERAAGLVCSSDMELRELTSLDLSPRGCVVPNVVDLAGVSADADRFRGRHALGDAFVMLFAGRLVENKGLHLAFSAFAEAARQHSDAHLVVVGPDVDGTGEAVRRRAQQAGLGSRLHMLGLLAGSDYWDAVAGADVLVLPSYSENFAMVAAEAMGLGVPVLLSDRVGIAALVSEYHAGLVAPLDQSAISEAVMSMLSCRQGLREMGRNGERLVREQFSRGAVGRRFAGVLESVLTGHAHSRVALR